MWIRIGVVLSSWFVGSIVFGLLIGKTIAKGSEWSLEEEDPGLPDGNRDLINLSQGVGVGTGVVTAEQHDRQHLPAARPLHQL